MFDKRLAVDLPRELIDEDIGRTQKQVLAISPLFVSISGVEFDSVNST